MIFVASSFSLAIKTKINIFGIDKILHFFIYLPLGFLVARALWFSNVKILKRNFVVLTLLFCILYGISDEFHQLFVANRNASLLDTLFDTVGSGAGLIIFKIYFTSNVHLRRRKWS